MIITRLRARDQQASQQYEGLNPTQLLQRLRLEALNTGLVNQQDYLLLRRALQHQFWLTVGVYSGTTILVSLAVTALFELAPRPPRLRDWDLKSANKEADNHAVDVDDLLLSWKADGCPQEIEVYLANLQNNARTRSIRVISSDEHVIFPTTFYRQLLVNRDPNGVNHIIAKAASIGGYAASPSFDLYVGITILINTDGADHVRLSALIDNSTENLPKFVFQGILVTWNQAPSPEGGGGAGTMVAEGFFRNPQARVNLDAPLGQDEWRRLAFAYAGDEAWRVRQDKKIPLELTGDKLVK